MIYNRSSKFGGPSVQRLFDYLQLCRVDISIRDIELISKSTVALDQPDKAGSYETNARVNHTQSLPITAILDHSKKNGSREFTLRLKAELSKQMKLNILSLTEAGICTFQQGNRRLEELHFYNVTSRYVDNFANSRESQWNFCLAFNKPELWVTRCLDILASTSCNVDYIILINCGRIHYFKVV
jgi:hypothetical protein